MICALHRIEIGEGPCGWCAAGVPPPTSAQRQTFDRAKGQAVKAGRLFFDWLTGNDDRGLLERIDREEGTELADAYDKFRAPPPQSSIGVVPARARPRFCASCGACISSADARFCPGCGAPVVGVVEAACAACGGQRTVVNERGAIETCARCSGSKVEPTG